MRCDVVDCVATWCEVLQCVVRVAMWCAELQCVVRRCSVVCGVAAWSAVLQRGVYTVLQRLVSTLQDGAHVATRCITLHHSQCTSAQLSIRFVRKTAISGPE
jgi:hypothetical protein